MKLLSTFVLGFFLLQNPLMAKELVFSVTNHEDSDIGTVDRDLDKYYTIESVEVTELEVVEESFAPSDIKSLGTIIVSLDKLIAFGKKVWKIVEAGRPVSTVNISDRVSVLPKTDDPQSTFYEMENWQAPKVKRYKVDYKNYFGMKVVSFVYSVRFEYGGEFDGKGKYLTGVGVEADNVSVAWGFEFNAANSVVSITNRGSKEDPVASVSMKIEYEAKSVMRTVKSTESFYVTGSGDMIKL